MPSQYLKTGSNAFSVYSLPIGTGQVMVDRPPSASSLKLNQYPVFSLPVLILSSVLPFHTSNLGTATTLLEDWTAEELSIAEEPPTTDELLSTAEEPPTADELLSPKAIGLPSSVTPAVLSSEQATTPNTNAHAETHADMLRKFLSMIFSLLPRQREQL